jgi:hypothetical protein
MLRGTRNFLPRLLLAAVSALLIFTALAPATLHAQTLNLEGQTGGFIIPGAYTIPSDPGHKWSSPSIGFHYLKSGTTVGDFYTSSITEGYGNWLEFGYTRNSHSNGSDFNRGGVSGTDGASDLWAFSGFNVYHAKAKFLSENYKKHKWVPAVAAGFIIRAQDQFVTGALQNGHPAHINEDIYVVATKLVRETKIPLMLNFGVRGTNAQLYGAGGEAGSQPIFTPIVAGAPCPQECTETNGPHFGAKPFGGIGIPIPVSKSDHALVIEPGAEIATEPRYVAVLSGAHVPTTETYGFRFTKLPTFRWTIDAGVGHIGNQLGPSLYIHANAVESVSLTYRFK